MARYTGEKMVVTFGTVVVSGQGRNLEVNQSASDIDATVYGDTDKVFLTGKTERSATLQILDDSASTVVRQAMAVGSSGTLTWYPIGSGTGNPKFQCATVRVTEANIAYPYDDVVLISTSMRLSGAVSETTA